MKRIVLLLIMMVLLSACGSVQSGQSYVDIKKNGREENVTMEKLTDTEETDKTRLPSDILLKDIDRIVIYQNDVRVDFTDEDEIKEIYKICQNMKLKKITYEEKCGDQFFIRFYGESDELYGFSISGDRVITEGGEYIGNEDYGEKFIRIFDKKTLN